MEKKKEFVINAFYYGIISFLAIIILYFLYRYCLLIIVSLLASSLIRPLFINIQSFFHIKSKFIKYIVAIFCVVMCYVMIVLFLGITLYVLVQTFYYLPDCIYDIYQQLLTHRYLISFTHHFYTTIDVFLNPDIDPRGAGYNVIQSKLAIGAGELFGMGLFKGNQTQLGFLYPKTTDFIFSLIAEEMGFIVAAGIIILYVILITKAIFVAKTAKDDLGSYIAIGIARSIFLPYGRKYRYDNGIITNNRYTITIC